MRHAEKIRELCAQGLDDRQIAERLGLSPLTVRTYRRKLGLLRQPRKPSRERMERTRELFLQGMTDAEIAERLGLSPFTVYQYRLRMGLLRRPRSSLPEVRRALVRIAEVAPKLLEATEKLLERGPPPPKETLAYWNELAHRLAVLALHLPELGEKMGYALDGLPELVKRNPEAGK